jgi:hypothetical protein
MEQQLQMSEGGYRTQIPNPRTFRTDALSTETYDVMVVEFADVMETGLGSFANSPKQLYIALATTADPTAKQIENASTGIVPVFEDWAITSWLVTGITAQNANLTNS